MPDHFLGGDFPSFKWQQIAGCLPDDLTGWTVLDVGCNAGFYSFELARRGATVLGDRRERRTTWRRRAGPRRRTGWTDAVRFRRMQRVRARALLGEQFDLVWFMGVFYHLRYPLLGLDISRAGSAGAWCSRR